VPDLHSPRRWRNLHSPRQSAYRAIPDVAALADSVGAYRIWLGGRETIGAGTSASTPLWAGLIARLRQATGNRIGWLTPLLYRPDLEGAFSDVTRGHNRISNRGGAYHARVGWDCCTGHGTPNGDELLKRLRALYRPARARRER
jgi:kumamolisin